MSLVIDVRFDARQFEAQLRALQTELGEKAMARALNRTADTVRARATDLVSAQVPGLGKRILKGQFSITRAKPQPSRQFAIVRVRAGRTLPLTLFKPRKTMRGVSAKIGGKRVSIPHAFFKPPGSSGNKGVYLRTLPGQAQKRGGVLYTDAATAFRSSRKQGIKAVKGMDLPISQIRVPGIPTILGEAAIRSAIERIARDRFVVVYQQELRYRAMTGKELTWPT